MSQQENYSKYYEVLELPAGSPYPEVRAAYVRLKELYGGDSIVMSPLEDELSREWKERVLDNIESAYEKLSELHRQGGSEQKSVNLQGSNKGDRKVDEAVRAMLDAITLFTGEALQQVREMLRLEIHEVAMVTKISKQHLKNIEEENFSALPEEVFLRGYLLSCAKLYKLNVDKVVNDYLGRYRAWKQGL